MNNLITRIKHIPQLFIKAKGCGLKKTPYDSKDFKTGIFGWFDYKPKHTRHVIETLSVKDQGNKNTCQWNATTSQKEVDEKCKLSVRSLVIKGKQMGLVSGNGFSNLRSGQKVLQKWGILKEGIIEENIREWNTYSDIKAIAGLDDEAAKHKISSYWSVSSRNDALKLLDDNRIITTGSKWYSGFNMSGGFSIPWIIYKIVGWYTGGHAFGMIGYDLNYNGRKVYICQNSFSKKWAENGKFYIDMGWLDKNNYGYFTNLDEIDKELGKFLIDYDGKNVKGNGDPAIYHIQHGKKKPYINWESYLAWNGMARGFNEVDKNLLDKVEKGDIMDIKKTDYWQFLKDVKEANRLSALLEILNKEN